jgi:hypothetical protein
MAEIVRGGDEWGQGLVYWVEWQTNDHEFRERYFRTRKQAESFALEIENELLIESVTQFNEAWAQMSPDQRRAFNERIERGARPRRGKSMAETKGKKAK